MAKYIIELNDEANKDLIGDAYYSCKQIPWWGVSKEIVKRLMPYTEPDRKAIEDEVWGLVGGIANMDNNDYGRVFGCIGRWTLLSKKTYQEVKEKYDAWKKRKEDETIKQKVIDLANDIGIHKLYSLVVDIRGE